MYVDLYRVELKFEFNENYFAPFIHLHKERNLLCTFHFCTETDLHCFSYSVDCRSVRHLSETPEVRELMRRQKRMFRFLLLSFSSRRGVQVLVETYFPGFLFLPRRKRSQERSPLRRGGKSIKAREFSLTSAVFRRSSREQSSTTFPFPQT